jgi:hypothetical protein
MTNVRRLQKALDRVFGDVKHWGQGLWGLVQESDIRDWGDGKRDLAPAPTCGTSFCLAGHATILAGHKPLLARGTSRIEYVALKGKVRATIAGDEHPETVGNAATDWLDMPYKQADLMFEASNSLADLYAYAFLFTGGKITIPDWHPEFEDADGEYYSETPNFPAEVAEVLGRVLNHSWPVQAYDAYSGNQDRIDHLIAKQVERATLAADQRGRAHARHGA